RRVLFRSGVRKTRTCSGDRVIRPGTEQPDGEPGCGELLPDLPRRVQCLLTVGVHHEQNRATHAGPFATAERTSSATLAESLSSTVLSPPVCRNHAKYSKIGRAHV